MGSFQCLQQKEIKWLLLLKPKSNKQKWNQPTKKKKNKPKSCLKTHTHTSKLSNKRCGDLKKCEQGILMWLILLTSPLSPLSSLLTFIIFSPVPSFPFFHPCSSATSLPLSPADFYPSVSISNFFSFKKWKFITGIGKSREMKQKCLQAVLRIIHNLNLKIATSTILLSWCFLLFLLFVFFFNFSHIFLSFFRI